ncbi:MAG: nucleoside-triphosphatase [Desulfurococcales archaeon]|nr:nucleoside-triphosphatase [Desulfurococcales archaeon]
MTGRIGLTGPPGSGKTTIARKTVSLLHSLECRVGGFYTPEVRSGEHRLGFQVEDIETGRRVWLAKKGIMGRLRVGSYSVFDDAGSFIYNILCKAIDSEFLVIDEVGPMELVFQDVSMKMKEVLSKADRYLVVYHRKLRNSRPEIYELIKSRGKTFWIDKNNRDNVWREVESEVVSVCKK